MTKQQFRWWKKTGGLPVPWWEQAVYVILFVLIYLIVT